METLKPTTKKRTRSRRSITPPSLEKVLFPVVRIERQLDDKGLLTTATRASLTQSTEAGLTATRRSNDRTYTVAKLTLSCVAEEDDSNRTLLSASITCLAYFLHDEGVTVEEAEKWIESGGAKLVDGLVVQIYSLAVLEFERLIAGTGLPPLRTPMQMPSFEGEGERISDSSS